MGVYKSKKPTKDGRQYFFRIKYKDILGVVHDYSSPKYFTKKEATQEEALFKVNINNQTSRSVNSITLDSIFEEFINFKSKKVKPQSLTAIYTRFKHLKPIASKKINDLNFTMYTAFTKELDKQDLSIDFKNRVLGLFKELIRYSNRYYNTSDSILKFVESYVQIGSAKKEMEVYSLDEYLKFESVIDDLKFKVLFQVLYYLGLRVSEARALQFRDINFVDKNLVINKTITDNIKDETWSISTPKTKGSNRVLPLTQKLLDGLTAMLEEAKKYKDFNDEWFVFGYTKPTPVSVIFKKKNLYANLAEVKQIRVHDFRHSCATLLDYYGANVTLISKWLGHASITITYNTYIHFYQSQFDGMVDILNGLPADID